MRRSWPLVALLVVALGAGAWFLLQGSGAGPQPVVPGDAPGREQGAPPTLLGAPDRPASRAGSMGEEAPSEAPAEAGAGDEKEPRLRGVVVDDETGAPVPGARILVEAASSPCPRIPESLAPSTRRTDAGRRHAADVPLVTDKDGTFSIAEGRLVDVFQRAAGYVDVFARAAGYVMGCVCMVGPFAPVTIRLKRGLSISGVVVRDRGGPVANALVTASPAPGVPRLPGHAEVATSDAEGKFSLTGLLPGPVVVGADHPKHMPTSLAPMEPGRDNVRIVLVPALVATFRVRTDDGKEPDAPSLAWKTSGSPPRDGIQLLGVPEATEAAGNDADPAAPKVGTFAYPTVRLPCDRPDVTLTVKSIGYMPWVFGPEPLPAEGGERTYEVNLDRDLTLGSLKVVLEDRDGKALSFVGEKAQAVPWRRDGKPIPGGVVLKPGEALEMPALPAGGYGLLVRSPLHAPALVATEVVAGRETEAKAVVGPPAKVRVKFTAPEALIVKFQLRMGRDLDYPFPEAEAGKAATAQGDAEGDTGALDGVLHAGADGLLLTGLATGRHVIEVVSPDLVATATPVDLVEGETREVEIAVTKR